MYVLLVPSRMSAQQVAQLVLLVSSLKNNPPSALLVLLVPFLLMKEQKVVKHVKLEPMVQMLAVQVVLLVVQAMQVAVKDRLLVMLALLVDLQVMKEVVGVVCVKLVRFLMLEVPVAQNAHQVPSLVMKVLHALNVSVDDSQLMLDLPTVMQHHEDLSWQMVELRMQPCVHQDDTHRLKVQILALLQPLERLLQKKVQVMWLNVQLERMLLKLGHPHALLVQMERFPQLVVVLVKHVQLALSRMTTAQSAWCVQQELMLILNQVHTVPLVQLALSLHHPVLLLAAFVQLANFLHLVHLNAHHVLQGRMQVKMEVVSVLCVHLVPTLRKKDQIRATRVPSELLLARVVKQVATSVQQVQLHLMMVLKSAHLVQLERMR